MNISITEYIKAAQAQNIFGEMLVHTHKTPPRAAQTKETERPLAPGTQAALAARGINYLYTHQADAIDKARLGQHVVVATATASGKSLCYSIPIIEELSTDPHGRALLMFPTKALGHDQINNFNSFADTANTQIRAVAYDGDTPRNQRRDIREKAQVIVSNIDMAAASILPQHQHWRAFFNNLHYVVIDEAHYYRGVTGSHLAMVIRRLRRLCAHYGASPTFILCSATLANSKEHAEALTGLPFASVVSDGSPANAKTFLMLNPSAMSMDDAGINSRAGAIVAGLMMSGIKTLTFVSNRPAAERVTQYAQQTLVAQAAGARLRGINGERLMDLSQRIQPYRAGYLPEYRRNAEAALRCGELLGLVSTNAMELGVDIGGLDAALLTGYPGTIASFWQQAGRAGREQTESLVLLLLKDNPVDQFFGANPLALYDAAHESARISLNNYSILADHLLCAAVEKPLTRNDFQYFGEQETTRVAQSLCRQGKLVTLPDLSRAAPPNTDNPSYKINMRGIGHHQQVEVINAANKSVIEKLDLASALMELYPGATYSHRGKAFRITECDDSNWKAYAKPADSYQFTTPVTETLVQTSEGEIKEVGIRGAKAFVGDAEVLVRVTGYRVKDMYEKGSGVFYPVEGRPALTLGAKAFWLGIAPNAPLPFAIKTNPAGSLHAFSHLAINALSMLAMCDHGDLDEALLMNSPLSAEPIAFIYERHEGGVGIVDYALERPQELLMRMKQMVENCACQYGCPACVEAARCHDDNGIKPSKEGLKALLKRFV